MKALTKILTGTAAVAALVGAAAPAAAQGYPSYPGYGYGYGGNNVVGTILNSILGGRNYGTNQRYAVEQCVRAVEYRINTRGFDNEGGRYRQYGYGYGYNNSYANNYAGARVVRVTEVRPRSNGGVKIIGLASSGTNSGYGYGNPYGQPGYGNPYGQPGYGNPYGQPGYGNPYGAPYGNAYGYNGMQADARFDCTVDSRGRITDIDAKRIYNNGYGYRY